jgi:hypothetical protein
MNLLTRVVAFLRPAGKTPEDIAAQQDSASARDEIETIRLSQTRGAGSAGQNYQSGRGSHQ